MIDQWTTFLEARAQEWNLSQGKWRCLFLNNYGLQSSNIVLLWFQNGDTFPRIATKLCTQKSILQREFENLAHAYPCASSVVPKPLSFGKQGNFWALWMEGVPGTPPAPDDYRLEPVTKILISMHEALRNQGGRISPERYRRMVSDPIAVVEQLGKDTMVLAGCKELLNKVTAEWLDSMPVIPQHGDLFSGNLLSHGDQWHVVDWENFGMIDLPLYDLLTLLIGRLTAEEKAVGYWDPLLVQQAAPLVSSYARRLNLPPAAVSLLIPLTLVNWCYLHWCDGRKPFVDRIYKTLRQYFDGADEWNRIFISP